MNRRQNVSNEIIFRVSQDAERTPSYFVFMAISGILATVAFLTDSIPLLIGAMIVAPAFPPLALIAFAIAGGQYKLAIRGLVNASLGFLMALGFAALTTWLLNALGVIEPETNLVNRPLLEERVRVGWYSGIAGMAAGIAGTAATARNRMDTLIGTVASLALVPAGAAGAIALISGDYIRAAGGFILLLINALTIVAAGIFVVIISRPGAETIKERDRHARDSSERESA